jgi:hypothetical protein
MGRGPHFWPIPTVHPARPNLAVRAPWVACRHVGPVCQSNERVGSSGCGDDGWSPPVTSLRAAAATELAKSAAVLVGDLGLRYRDLRTISPYKRALAATRFSPLLSQFILDTAIAYCRARRV